ncbi:conjugal transfer protein [Streptomyces longisporoflavus]|uniref:Conjugal transfer protein n=1 Tax=Streptomyces longisporoflavus TaxID=28044 RepID=A0ABW7R422_9ACTN
MFRSTSPPTGATKRPAAAGLALTRMRRRVQFGRAGVWAALAAGPLALAVAVGRPSPTVAASPEPREQRTAQTTSVADPSDYVAEFVDAWLRSSDDASSAASRRAQAMAPDVPLPSLDEDAPTPRRVTPVRSAPREGGRWSVTVAAQYADAVRYFAVPAIIAADGGSFAVTTAPALVAAPSEHPLPEPTYKVTVEEGPLTATAGEFLAAYLAGRGEVARYLAPGVKLSAVSPAAATSVEVEEVSAREESAAGERVPRDGTRVHVLVTVEARGKSGRWPLAYELTLTARGGRWEIAALEAGTTATAGGARR